MRILVIMDGFFPGKKYGGPPVSIDNFCTLMSDYDCYVVTRDHDLFEKRKFTDISKGWNERGNCRVLYLDDKMYRKSVFERIILKIKPDIIYLQSLFQRCVLPCLQLAKKYNIKLLLAPRGELCHGALKLKKYKKIPYIKALKLFGLVNNVHFQSTSDEESRAIHCILNCSSNKIHRLENIPSIPKANLQHCTKMEGVGRFVFLSRVHPKKNLLGAIKLLNHIKGKAIFHIYGPIEDKDYWKACKEAIRVLPANVTVEYKGLISHDQVHKVFSCYNAFLFPTLSENYGHVIAESLISGTPVIISDQTPWSDLKEHKAGWDFALDDYNGYIMAIEYIIKINASKMLELQNSARIYAYNKMNLNVLKMDYKKVFEMCVEAEKIHNCK